MTTLRSREINRVIHASCITYRARERTLSYDITLRYTQHPPRVVRSNYVTTCLLPTEPHVLFLLDIDSKNLFKAAIIVVQITGKWILKCRIYGHFLDCSMALLHTTVNFSMF